MRGLRSPDLANDASALTAVLGTILMMGIAALLASGVFLATEKIDWKGSATVGPELVFLTRTATETEWAVRVTSGTQARPLDEFQFSLTRPDATVLLVDVEANGDFAAGVDDWYAATTAPGGFVAAQSTMGPPTTGHVRIAFHDLTADGLLTTSDEIRVTVDATDPDAEFDDSLDRGTWTLVVLHEPTDRFAGQVDATIG